MRNTYLFPSFPTRSNESDEQLPLPFDDSSNHRDPAERRPVTTIYALDVGDRWGRRYELVVHQDPLSLCILAYRLRQRSSH